MSIHLVQAESGLPNSDLTLISIINMIATHVYNVCVAHVRHTCFGPVLLTHTFLV